MKVSEQLLQFIWHKKILGNKELVCTNGHPLKLIDVGDWNQNEGPDFIFAKVDYQNLIFIGNIEIHTKSSDWLLHGHDKQSNYQKIILHVVYENDVEITSLKDKNIPTLELKNYIDAALLERYQQLLSAEQKFIPCEKLISEQKIPMFFHEENMLRKLDLKRIELENELSQHKNNLEKVLFHNLAYAFGLKINAEIFRQIAEHLDFNIITKIRQNPVLLEALFFGFSGWLQEPKDEQTSIWQREFEFLKFKYQLSDFMISPNYSKLRPPNFPNIRLSQLAQLYHQEPHLFSKIKDATNVKDLKSIFENIKTSIYWESHYNFGKSSPVSIEKKLSSNFIDLLLINVILPLKYTLEINDNEEVNDLILRYYQQIKPENNHIIDGWKALGISVKSGLDAQSLLYQHKHYCLIKKCLNCGIGLKILKENE